MCITPKLSGRMSDDDRWWLVGDALWVVANSGDWRRMTLSIGTADVRFILLVYAKEF